MKQLLYILLSFLFISTLSCGNNALDAAQNPLPYFDVNAWMQDQVELLEQMELQKRTLWNSKNIKDTVFSPDWEKELQDFLQLPISESSWKNDFILVAQTDPRKMLPTEISTFQSRTKRNKLREFSITYRDKKVLSLDLKFNQETWLKRRDVNLKFVSGQGYEIRGVQKTRFFPEESFSIAGTFVSPQKEQ